jgi:hypothetical protein
MEVAGRIGASVSVSVPKTWPTVQAEKLGFLSIYQTWEVGLFSSEALNHLRSISLGR